MSTKATADDQAGTTSTATAPNKPKANRGKVIRVFLDIDISGWRAAYQRACDFVANCNLRYSLTSNVLEELGGSEKSRIRKELYPNDFE